MLSHTGSNPDLAGTFDRIDTDQLFSIPNGQRRRQSGSLSQCLKSGPRHIPELGIVDQLRCFAEELHCEPKLACLIPADVPALDQCLEKILHRTDGNSEVPTQLGERVSAFLRAEKLED